MRRTLLTAAFCLLSGAASAATISRPYGPQTAGEQSPEQLAQVGGVLPDPCLRAANAEAHDKWLSVHRGVPFAHRYNARMQIFWARRDAHQSNEQGCWNRLGIAEDDNAP